MSNDTNERLRRISENLKDAQEQLETLLTYVADEEKADEGASQGENTKAGDQNDIAPSDVREK